MTDETENWYAECHQMLHDLKDGGRGNYIGFPQCELLDHACGILNKAYGAHCYLVGSATQTKAYRDVDVRMIMFDEEYNKLFGTSTLSAFWSVTCTSISYWLREVTDLPVDFQIQQMSRANKVYRGHGRNALGLKIDLDMEADELPLFLRKPDC